MIALSAEQRRETPEKGTKRIRPSIPCKPRRRWNKDLKMIMIADPANVALMEINIRSQCCGLPPKFGRVHTSALAVRSFSDRRRGPQDSPTLCRGRLFLLTSTDRQPSR